SARDGDPGPQILRQVSDAAVRLAIANRRPIRLAGRIHQNDAAAIAPEARKAAGGRVALEITQAGITPPGLLQEFVYDPEPFDPRLMVAKPFNDDAALR